MNYQPGAHIIASLKTADERLILRHKGFRDLMEELVQNYDLKQLGEVYHDFEPAGFTAVICLSESHISIHTWPEHLLINTDIYLSNYQRNNDGTVQKIFQEICSFFKADILSQQLIRR